MNSSGPRGRRRGKPDTRARIPDAARRRFLDGGYRAFRLRAIAADADVDFALVSYYFGSKKGLLTAVLAAVPNPPGIVDHVIDGDLVTLPERALRAVLDLWDNPESGAPLRALVAGAAHDAAFAAVVRETMQQPVIDTLAERIGGRDARTRAAVSTRRSPVSLGPATCSASSRSPRCRPMTLSRSIGRRCAWVSRLLSTLAEQSIIRLFAIPARRRAMRPPSGTARHLVSQ